MYSLKTAFCATLICLALGYPMAYAISRASKTTQSILLLVIILPFWTSFLLRVYALEGIIRDGGILNTVLLRVALMSHPLKIMRTSLSVYLRIIYSSLPFMLLPLFPTLLKLCTPVLGSGARLVTVPASCSLADRSTHRHWSVCGVGSRLSGTPSCCATGRSCRQHCCRSRSPSPPPPLRSYWEHWPPSRWCGSGDFG